MNLQLFFIFVKILIYYRTVIYKLSCLTANNLLKSDYKLKIKKNNSYILILLLIILINIYILINKWIDILLSTLNLLLRHLIYILIYLIITIYNTCKIWMDLLFRRLLLISINSLINCLLIILTVNLMIIMLIKNKISLIINSINNIWDLRNTSRWWL